MIKNYLNYIKEAKDRLYGGGNLFSNNHRDPNLPSSCAMIDIDNISIIDGRINAIIEDKFKFDSKFLGNPLEGQGTWQRKKLVDICNILKCDLIFLETSTNTQYHLKDDIITKLSNINNYNIIKTDNIIYIEIRFGRAKSVMFRTEGKKVSDINNNEIFKSAILLSEKLNISLYLINDVKPDELIYIKELKSDTIHKINPFDPDSWKEVYGNLGLL